MMRKYIELGIDAPIEDPADDCLDRSAFVKRILKIIEGTPVSSNIRIGIHGAWGSGKTTTMNLLRYRCKEAGHPVSIYNPWQFHNREEAWKGFVSSIDKGLAEWEGRIIGSFKRKNLIKKASEKVREVTAVTEIGKMFGTLVLAPLEGLLEQTKQRVQEELDKTLKDKRLFIFVDDLDRADPNIAYDILMFLNEIVDLNRCLYVIGLDVNVASQAIRNKIGDVNCKEFLDKIIHWQYELPEPTDFEWHELLDKEIDSLGQDIKKEALKSIFYQLPKNPRKLKHFLRYIAGLHKSFLSRFGDYELDWKILYLTQLIKIEFPGMFKKISTDERLLRDLAQGMLKISHENDDANPEWQQRLNELAKDFSPENKERLQMLCGSIKAHGWMAGTDELQKYMLIIEAPELFTWKEYYEFKKKLLCLSEKERINKLRSLIRKARKDKEVERVREFIRMLIRDREQLYSQAVEEIDLETGIKPLLTQVSKVMDICFFLLEIKDIFEGYNPVFNEDIFKEWYANLIKWAHFKREDGKEYIYDEIREREAKLAYKLSTKLKHRASVILEIVSKEQNRSSHPEAFKEIHDKITGMLEKALVEQLIERFKKIDGIKELWGENYRSEKRLLFNENSSFHIEEVYNALKSVADEASNDPNVHKNFHEYTVMLFYGATEESNLAPMDKVQELLKEKKELIDIIWKATVSRQMNRRTVGSLEGYRSKIIKAGLLREEQLKTSEWYAELISDVRDKVS